MSDEFAMTYPCYFPMGDMGFHFITSDGDHCFPLLTDRDVVERFFRDKFSDAREITMTVHTMPERDALLETLRDMEADFRAGSHQVSHVAFDVGGQAVVPRTTIREFIEYLEEQA